MQLSLKLGGTNDDFKWVKVHGTAPLLKDLIILEGYDNT